MQVSPIRRRRLKDFAVGAGLLIFLIGLVAAFLHVLFAMPELSLLGRAIRLLALALVGVGWWLAASLIIGWRSP